MSKKSIIDFFKYDLQCPLQNQLSSWGAVSIDDKRQAFRIWAHEHRRLIDGGWWVAVDCSDIPDAQKFPGAPERRKHVEALRAGLPTAGVIVTAVDETAAAKEIKTYDGEQLVVVAPELRTIGNDVWARIVRKITVTEFRMIGRPTTGASAANEWHPVRSAKLPIPPPGNRNSGNVLTSTIKA